jgi:hypothetical protein
MVDILGMISHVWSCKGFRYKYFWNPKVTCRLFNFMVHFYKKINNCWILAPYHPSKYHVPNGQGLKCICSCIYYQYIHQYYWSIQTLANDQDFPNEIFVFFQQWVSISYKQFLIHIFLFQTFALHSLFNKLTIHKTLSYNFSLQTCLVHHYTFINTHMQRKNHII